MVVTAVLADLLRDGVRLDFTDPARPTFRVLPEHRPLVAALLAPATKAQTQGVLRQIAEYRALLLRMFALTAHGADADPAACRRAVQDEMRLHDDLGPRLADLVLATTTREYQHQTARCAYCGDPDCPPAGGVAGYT